MLVNLFKLKTHYINTSYAIEEFTQVIDGEEELDVNVINSGYENGLIPIDKLLNILKEIREDGKTTHVDIHHDLGEYEISQFKLEIPTDEAKEEYYKEKNKLRVKAARIAELEMELSQLKNEIINNDDFPF